METITQIARYSTKKDGSALIASNGRPYTSVRIKTQSKGDAWISGFGNKENQAWKIGDQVDITIEQKGDYLNFTMPKKDQTPQTDARLANLIEFKLLPMMLQMNGRIEMMMKHMDLEPDTEYPEMDSTNDGSPF